MGTGAFGAGVFGMNMECEQLFGPGSEGLFWPVTATLSGVPACCMIRLCYVPVAR